VECGGLGGDKLGAASAAACEHQCCEDNYCEVWQWKKNLNSNDAGGCWRGWCAGFRTSPDWVGGIRDSPLTPPSPGTLPAEATIDYNDSSWQLINAPHDSLIDSSASKDACPTGCSGRSYIPRYVSWYRKSFKLPKEWEGNAIWLYFDGLFRDGNIYLNGQNLTAHNSGYTSFAVRLDGQNGLKYGDSDGDQNVMAIFIDSDKGKSGWWYEGGGLVRV
jgi:hypothetical protein